MADGGWRMPDAATPFDEDLDPVEQGQLGTGLGADHSVGHLITEFLGQGPEAVHLELGGIFAAEGVDLGPEL